MFIIMSFLFWEVMKSCLCFCLSVLLSSSLLFLGLELGVYFVMLIFFSGVLALMVYFCSLNMKESKFNILLFFFVSLICSIYLSFYLISEDFLLMENKFVYDDMEFFFLIWLIFVLLILLSFLSSSFFKSCLRSL
uniref:NADH dehydrogenase subunit 6 n=1 Tax=Physaloptera clausa TaxID=3051302 RepID=UPI0030014083|nr:NADH dehydrogenase subunit 6 [Physaloptera clausa]